MRRERVHEAALVAGLEPELRPWHPHVTIARCRDVAPQSLRSFLKVNLDLDAGMIRGMFGAAPAIPVRVCSVNTLEWLVCIPDRSVGEYLVDLMTDPAKEGWEVLGGQEYAGVEFRPNPVLDQANQILRRHPQQRSC